MFQRRSRRALAIFALALSSVTTGCQTEQPVTYPKADPSTFTETLHGVEVADPYRWLEKEDAPATRAWIEAQNKITFGYLEAIPEREAIRKRITDLWNFAKHGLPYERGGRYFFTRNSGLQNQSVLYTADALDADPRVLLDPNTLSADGTVALASYSVSKDGSKIAYATSSGGSDWREWRVRDVATGADRTDRVEWSKFSGASWSPDGSGFYYSRYDKPEAGGKLQAKNEFHKLYFHRLGTPQSEDELILEDREHPRHGFGAEVTDDGAYLCISVWRGTERKNMFYYRTLGESGCEGGPIVRLIDAFDASFSFVGNEGSLFYFLTSDGAPRNRLIAIDVERPARDAWREIIPESKHLLQSVSLLDGKFIARYLQDAHTRVAVFGRDGTRSGDVALPGIGTANGFGGEPDDTETFYSYSSFTTPPSIYRYDVRTGKSELFFRPDVDFDPNAFVTEQVFYESADGTRVPMFITHKRGLKRDGSNPTVLYGYGGFNISLTPRFSVANVVWMEMGGIFAQPNLRGGGEYGRAWHLSGTKLRKQNVFDDFIAAAEWLQAENYTKPAKLAIFGGSNGGLLVGACMTQRPELFGAALPAVGVLDMLRFHKFTIGHAWTSDYGSPENAEEFRYLLGYSPYHNLKRGVAYPATLVTTGDHDDRVVPAHSFKFAARLQECHKGDAPVLIRIETRAGHGAGKPTSMRIEEAADRWAFLVRTLQVR